MSAAITSQNFTFLNVYEPQLDRLGALAERYFADDPETCLIKLRQFAELLARQVAARNGLAEAADEGPNATQADLLRRLRLDAAVPAQVLDLFHRLRTTGNQAVHDHRGVHRGDHRTALANLKLGRQLAIWFHRTYGQNPAFKPGPFQPPATPAHPDADTLKELEAFRAERLKLLDAAARAQEDAEAAARARESAEERAHREAEDRAIWEQLAAEAEAEVQAVLAQLAAVQAAAAQASPTARFEQQQKAEAAADAIELDEKATRVLIDEQLRARGWEADTLTLRYGSGTRPAKGRNLAIAEWPTESGPADHALFVGLQCIGTVEAKRKNKSACNALGQSERYSRDIKLKDGEADTAGGPWGEFRVPFVFSCNGRPYLKQVETESGIWFRDTRKLTNLARALVDWPTPDGLQGQLGIDIDAADAALKTQPMQFGFPLRPYQEKAIRAVEKSLADGKRTMLVAMATGTGKTKLSIAMLYRLLAAKRFQRICFVVDRSALGEQAAGEFTTTNVISARTFSDIFNLKGLETKVPDTETKIHICTIQGLVKRVLYAAEPLDAPPIDQYDLIVVDECHRGYLLDRELSDDELAFRNQTDYVSKYRRVLEHFDAVKIGLTATPALHTAQIFGEPVYTYSYREAVIDGYLIDHEPPVRIITELSQVGIHYDRGDDIDLLNTRTGTVQSTQTPDEIDFEVEAFNKTVITEPFNRVVAEELARHIDPDEPGKTLVFAANDRHADLVVHLLKEAFQARYGAIENTAVAKITGSVDKPRTLILSYRNDANPKVVVTVDLLTTGIDVPSIVNLVFIRRVNSRILYEQMLGRGTRRCDDIGKETFRIFDAVDLYANLQRLTEMRPVVVDPNITLEQLFEELTRVTESAHRRENILQTIRDQIVVKLRRRLPKLTKQAREQYEAVAGETPEATLQRLQNDPLDETAAWAKARPALGALLDWDPDKSSTPPLIPISAHPDRIADVRAGYGSADKPEDFLDGFTSWIKHNVNQVAALTVVVQRPRDLTRAQLKELRLRLDGLGYSDANLRRAWQDANPHGNNSQIAASIVGFIRQAALGDALIPFDQRVQGAMQRILASRDWTDQQRRWLERIAKQLRETIVVDRPALDQPPFDAAGGFKRLNTVFDGQLEALLGDINEELWRDAS
jgi:type I restriction enzyme, R subunit